MRRNFLSLLKLVIVIVLIIILGAYLMQNIDSKNHDFQRFDKYLKSKFKFEGFGIEKGKQKDIHHTGSFFNGSPKNVNKKKIDWHDYKFMKVEESRAGLGEHGKASSLKDNELDMEDKLLKRNGFNAYLR